MTRRDLVLAALAPAKGATHSPVQVQKLFYLLDRNISGLVGGPHFHHVPYNYGAFDKQVYDELESLSSEGLVSIYPEKSWKSYKLTDHGQQEAEALLEVLPITARDYIKRASEYVTHLSFTQLVSAMYRAYPETRQNSVFQE